MRIPILISLTLLPFLSKSQYFELKPNHFETINVSDSNYNKDYIVFNYPNKTASELFKGVESACNEIFNSSKDVMSKVDDKSITLNWRGDNLLTQGMGAQKTFIFTPTLTILFKDDKIRINAPKIGEITGYDTHGITISLLPDGGNQGGFFGVEYHLFNKKGEVNSKFKNAKKIIDATYNNFVTTLVNKLNSSFNDKW